MMRCVALIAALALAPLPALADPASDSDAIEQCLSPAGSMKAPSSSFRSVAHSACRFDLTARRVVDFHARLVTGG